MKRLSKAVAFCLAACLVLEVSARIDDFVRYGAPVLAPYTMDSIFEFTPAGKRGKPHGRYQKWALNSIGIRGPELRPGRITIACMGASETFGTQESPGAEYPGQLERELNRRAGGETYQVANLSYPGMRLVTALRLVPSLLDAVRPEVALIYPTPTQYLFRTVEAPAAAPERAPTFGLRLPDKLHERLKSTLPEPVLEVGRRVEIGLAVARYGPVMTRVPEERLRFCRADLAKAITMLRERGIEPVVLTHATRFGANVSPTDRAQLTMWRKFYPLVDEEALLDAERRTNEIVRQAAREHKVLLVDMEAKMPTGSKYFYDYLHFTDEGARAFAAIIADALIAGAPPVMTNFAGVQPSPDEQTGQKATYRNSLDGPECRNRTSAMTIAATEKRSS